MALRPIPLCGYREALRWLLRRRRRFRVTGDSMYPTLRAGEEVLVDLSAYRRTSPRPGDVVVARHPHLPDQRVIKRVSRVGEGGACHLIGDNADPTASTDSRVWGSLPVADILGRVSARCSS